jgi:2-dehydro-3-deoxyphosphogluconate aldolase/(4S)-4-hydroxy-2-oxoglutarate aldolase
MTDVKMTIDDVLALGHVMPVIVIDDADKAVPLAETLLANGIRTIEITLRTPAALESIAAIADQCPDMVVGAGTILSPELAQASASAGARFVVSPGSTEAVVTGCQDADVPLLPGASTVSEMMALAEQGFHVIKFFPAMAAGGPNFIKSLASPLPHLTFCPTGGITATTAPDWLSLPNVPCLGGSWIAPATLINAGDWDAIGAHAKAASQL